MGWMTMNKKYTMVAHLGMKSLTWCDTWTIFLVEMWIWGDGVVQSLVISQVIILWRRHWQSSNQDAQDELEFVREWLCVSIYSWQGKVWVGSQRHLLTPLQKQFCFFFSQIWLRWSQITNHVGSNIPQTSNSLNSCRGPIPDYGNQSPIVL